MKSEVWKHSLALMGAFCITLGLAGCNPAAEVPTAGDGPKQSAAAENKAKQESKPVDAAKPGATKDDSTKGEGGSNLE
jgi:hypothetical protein